MIPRISFLASLASCLVLSLMTFEKYEKMIIPRQHSNSRTVVIPFNSFESGGIQKHQDNLNSAIVIPTKGGKAFQQNDTYKFVSSEGFSNSEDKELYSTASSVRVGKESRNFIQPDSTSIGKALECLRHSKPELPDLFYPQDAFQHFHHIHNRLARWIQKDNHKPHRAAGYSGPWIENQWISKFEQELEANNYSLPDVFGPYIPILIPWTDIWVKNRWSYPKDLVLALKDLLREDVLYVTVNQNADGFVGRCKEFSDLQNKFHIVVLSAGGYGHVPVPLLKQPEVPLPKIPLGQRKHLISYVGKSTNAPDHMRQKMIGQENHYYYYGKKWREVMAQSKFSLCPRGYGRTSYHVMEALQMGLVPIHVYQDLPWLPYRNLMKNISYSVAVENLPDLISQLSKIPDSEIARMEDEIEKLREELFSLEGALMQIAKFMLNPESSELECQTLPSDSGSGKKNTDRWSS